MEKNFKRLFCALFALGLSAPAFANSSVVVPSQHGGFKVGVDALYLRATNSDLDYATLFATLRSPINQINASVDPNYTWGFYVQAGYLVPCTGNDLTLGYTYLHTKDTDGIVVSSQTPSAQIVPLNYINSALALGFLAADSKAEFDLNTVDLELGQRFTTGGYDMRMFAGLRYTSLDHTFSTNGNDLNLGDDLGITTLGASQEFTSNYRGIGPRIGVDGRYCLQSGFGIDADLSTSLLVGKIEPKYHAVYITNPNTNALNIFSETNGSRSRIVPVLEAKLGFDYTHIVDRCAKSAVIFEAGYQVTNYFNADEHAAVVGQTFGPITATTTTDVAFDGLYFGVKYYA